MNNNNNKELWPRLLRVGKAVKYLGVNPHYFNDHIRPYLTEIPIGKQGKVSRVKQLVRQATIKLAGKGQKKSSSFPSSNLPSVTFILNINNGCMMNKSIDSSNSHHVIWKDFIPFTKRLICSNDKTASFIAMSN